MLGRAEGFLEGMAWGWWGGRDSGLGPEGHGKTRAGSQMEMRLRTQPRLGLHRVLGA